MITNGDFEILQNKGSYCNECAVGWKMVQSCNNDNKDGTHSYYEKSVPFDKRLDQTLYPFFSGNTKLWFSSLLCNNMKKGDLGCSNGHIFTKLQKKLEVGKVYKIEIHFFIPSIEVERDTQFYKHIGINFLKSEPDIPESFKNWRFLNDTAIYDKWFKKTWYVRSLCELEYFVIGLSYTKDWPNYKNEKEYIGVEYYADKVSVDEISESGLTEKIIPTPFCRCKDEVTKPKEPTFDSLNLFFKSNQFDIADNSLTKLNDLAEYLKKNPKLVLEVKGYTDDIGFNHQELSKNRVESVINYLQRVHKINPIRFIQMPLGNVEKSNSEALRQKNRKVVIRKSSLSMSQVVYQKVLYSSVDTAFKHLKLWLKMAKDEQKILLLFDSRLDSLKQNRKWALITDEIKTAYKQFKKPNDAFLLDSLKMEDQKYRTLEDEIHQLEKPSNDEENLFSYGKKSYSEIRKYDSLNFVGIKKFLDKNGWPNETEVGERASKAAFYIIDHCTDTINFQKYIPILESKCKQGEADWSDYATLFDRCELLCGRPQLYCTQFSPSEQDKSVFKLYRYDEKNAVNQRRKKLGLSTIKDFDFTIRLKQ